MFRHPCAAMSEIKNAALDKKGNFKTICNVEYTIVK